MEKDKYGDIDEGIREEQCPKKQAQRKEKWSKMLRSWEEWRTEKKDKLKHRIRKGIPDDYRGRVWCLLGGISDLRQRYIPDYYETLVSLSDKSSSIADIEVDLDRTFPEHEMFSEGSPGHSSLRRVLIAYSIHDTELGYCQGLPFIVAIFLLNTCEEDAFWLLVALLHKHDLRKLYLPGMKEVYVHMHVADALLKRHVSSVWKHIDNGDFLPSVFVPKWFFTVFINVLPLEASLRVIDLLFSEGTKIMYRVFISIFKLRKNFIRNTDRGKLLQYIRDIPNKLSSERLFATAFAIQVSRKHISLLVQEFKENSNLKDSQSTGQVSK